MSIPTLHVFINVWRLVVLTVVVICALAVYRRFRKKSVDERQESSRSGNWRVSMKLLIVLVLGVVLVMLFWYYRPTIELVY